MHGKRTMISARLVFVTCRTPAVLPETGVFAVKRPLISRGPSLASILQKLKEYSSEVFEWCRKVFSKEPFYESE